MKKKNQRKPRTSDVARLDFHDAFGNVYDRIRAKVTEKDRGISMIDRIEDRFNITQADVEYFRNKLKEREIKEFDELKEEARRGEKEPIKWTRDEKGNIVSPWSQKALKKEKF